MTLMGSLGGALLLLAQPLPAALPGEVAAAAPAQFRFAPPVGVPMTYRVTTRRIGRDGALINFALVYALEWQQVGRGYRLEAVLERIDSDARPDVTRALTMMLQPLVGEAMAYLVAPDGSRIDLVDPEQTWARVTARIETTGADAGRPEARRLAELIAALPAAERDRIINANVRQLPGQFETSAAVLNALRSNALFGRPDDYWETLAPRYEGLTPAQLDAEARRLLGQAGFTWVVVGDAATVKPQLEALGLPLEVRPAQ